jgi:hypothetical protein
LESSGGWSPACQDDVGLHADQFFRQRSRPIGVTVGRTNIHPQVAINDPTQVRKRLRERSEAKLPRGIVFVGPHEHADAPYAVALLRPRHHRPRRRAPKPRNELPPSHP